MTKLPFAIAAVAALSMAGSPASAGDLGPAFLTGLRACLANVDGKLPLNPPSQAQTDAGLVLADPASAAELKPFADLSPSERMFASVAAGDGAVELAEVASQRLCRIVVYRAADLAPVTSQVGPMAGDWAMVSDDPVANYAVYTGTILGSRKLTIAIRQPPAGSDFGDGSYIMTLTPAS